MGECTRYIRIDPAHTYAIDGIGKDFLASTIVMLVRMGHFGGGPVAVSLQNAYSRFMAFCTAYKKNTTISDFSYSTLKLPTNSFLTINRMIFHDFSMFYGCSPVPSTLFFVCG